MKRRGGRAERQRGAGLAFAGTLAVHVLTVVGFGLARPDGRAHVTPVYNVQLVAAPEPEPAARKAPEVVERPAEQPAPPAKKPPPRSPVAKTPPPAPQPEVKREPAPRTNPAEGPAPGVQPSTGTDVATVKTAGVDFAYPEYLRNLVGQIYRRWQRPVGNVPLKAEVLFLVHRDGTVSDLQFISRSGSFTFDLEAQGAIESAGNSRAFGQLPEGYPADVLPVNFFFNPGTLR